MIEDGILPNVTNGGSGILVIGGGKSAGDDVTLFWDALGTAMSQTITYVNGAANITGQSFAGFAVIAVASSVPQTPSGGLTDAENDALTGRAADIADHVNGGGGLFCTSQTGLTTPYGYLGSIGAFTFNFPPAFDAVTATAEGEAIGITDTNLDVCCWHDEYLTFPGFLDVLATNDLTGGTPCALGGSEVIIVQGIVLTPLTAQNLVGTDHTVTATVADDMGNPVVGVTVDFEVISGPHTGTMGSDVTDANGQATFTYTGLSVGLDTIQGCFIDNMMVEQCDEVTKEWIDINDPPEFNDPSPCGTTIPVAIGDLLTYTVTASDPDLADVVSLNATGVPSGASHTPGLPANGNPVSTDFSWTPGPGDVGTYVITYTASDGVNSVECTVTLEVPPACMEEATTTTLGTGCGATLSATPPVLGLPCTVTLDGNTPGAMAFINLSRPGPGGLFYEGCEIFLKPGAFYHIAVVVTDANGDASFTGDIPFNLIKCGVDFTIQAVVIGDQGPTSIGEITNGVLMTFGS